MTIGSTLVWAGKSLRDGARGEGLFSTRRHRHLEAKRGGWGNSRTTHLTSRVTSHLGHTIAHRSAEQYIQLLVLLVFANVYLKESVSAGGTFTSHPGCMNCPITIVVNPALHGRAGNGLV